MDSNRRRQAMSPQKSCAGYIETEILDNGYLKVEMTLDGAAGAGEIVSDTNNPGDMRAFSQLPFVPFLATEDGVRGSAYMIEDHEIPGVRAVANAMTKTAIIGRSPLN